MTAPPSWTVTALHVGSVQPLGPAGVPSGIVKHPVDGPVRLHATGVDGDAQADLKHHGGPDKAVHAYPLAHHPVWAADLPERAARFGPGRFGENLTVCGATEADVCIGDRFRIGAAVLEVSQGRQPCWKLNLRFEVPDMARRVQISGRTGWYFRVIAPGTVTVGDAGWLIERPNPEWSVARVNHLLYHRTLDVAALAALRDLPRLTGSWRTLAANRIANSRVEDWSARVETPAAP